MNEMRTDDERKWGGGPAGVMNSLPKGKLTRRLAADEVGRSEETLKRWHRDGTFKATHYMMQGSKKIWLYNEADIATMREIASRQRPGPKITTETGEAEWQEGKTKPLTSSTT